MDDPGSGISSRLEGVEGVVKWFDPRKGFGFIIGPQREDIFVHFSVIQGDGFRVLKDGATVQYDAERSGKGWKATRCSRVEELHVAPLNKRVTAEKPADNTVS